MPGDDPIPQRPLRAANKLQDAVLTARASNDMSGGTGVYNLFDADPQHISPWGVSGLVEGRRYNPGAQIEF